MDEAKRQLTKMAEKVKEFNEKFHVSEELSPQRKEFRRQHLQEELNEFAEAVSQSEHVDALLDLIYLAFGTLLELGCDPLTMFNAVHEANTAKIYKPSVQDIVKGGTAAKDVVKPEGWQPPDIQRLLNDMQIRKCVSRGLMEATSVFLEREKNYNKAEVKRADHFPLGAHSIFQMIHVKYMRLKADILAGGVINRDHPVDLINYADFMLDFIDGRL